MGSSHLQMSIPRAPPTYLSRHRWTCLAPFHTATMSTRRGIGLANSIARDLRAHHVGSAALRRHIHSRTPSQSLPRPEARLLPASSHSTACARSRPQQRHSSSNAAPKKTQLYDFHVSKGGKMVEFGGFSMPVTYGDMTISESALWTRSNASLFDVSHMYVYTM